MRVAQIQHKQRSGNSLNMDKKQPLTEHQTGYWWIKTAAQRKCEVSRVRLAGLAPRGSQATVSWPSNRGQHA